MHALLACVCVGQINTVASHSPAIFLLLGEGGGGGGEPLTGKGSPLAGKVSEFISCSAEIYQC